ncbi:MAG: class I SAM-dependent methyltransferase [Planctomycetales bacterium]|nr:class I SAM-dependent methyltransferase [Planctomycetales bacterium]
MNSRPASESNIRQQVVDVAHSLVGDTTRLAQELPALSLEQIDDRMDTLFADSLRQLDALGLRGPANQTPSSILWDIAAEQLQEGSLQTHARLKPHGYAGDYEMLYRICTFDVRGSELGAAFDRFFQRQAAPQAVRNRTRLMASHITQLAAASNSPLKVVSIGSGPAFDLCLAAERLAGDNLPCPHFVLVDIDPHALDFAQEQLGNWVSDDHVQLERANLFRLPKLKSLQERLSDADMIFCTGLFDYLDAGQAATLLRALRNCTHDSGEVYVFNFAHGNPSRAYMEWLGNWYRTYRSVDDLWDMAAQAGIASDQCEVDAEPTGVNLYLRAWRESHRQLY